MVAWNAEVAAPPATYPASGPISISWDRFWDRFTGEDFPMPGSAEWWANAPPQCRSLLDAPDGVVDGIAGGEVFTQVPESWQGLAGGVLCPRMSLGSMGCAGLSEQSTWPYVWFDEVYAVPGEPIQISVALEKEGAISWVDRVVVGLIPFSTLDETGSVLVELDASFSPRSYQDVVALPTAIEPGGGAKHHGSRERGSSRHDAVSKAYRHHGVLPTQGRPEYGPDYLRITLRGYSQSERRAWP